MKWGDLNQRQQSYLRIIYEYDQAQERNEQLRAALDKRSRPADQWRWIEYADAYAGHTRFKQRLIDEKLVDHGTGSTFEALRERELILVKYDVSIYIRLTTKGRRLVRQALNIQGPTTLPPGTLREWHWKALVYAYKAGERGIKEWPRGIGHMTVRRLEEYRVKGEDRPLIGWVEVPCEPYMRKRWPGDEGYLTTVRHVLRITPFGLQYYRENWQRYQGLYPGVDAPEPEV